MAVDERARYELQRTLIELMGEEAAMTLMRHLPPAGWGDVATRRDVDTLEQRMLLGFERLEARQDRFEERLDQRFRQFMATTITAVIASALASAGIALAASALA